MLCNRATDLPLATAILATSPALLVAAAAMVAPRRSGAMRGPAPDDRRPSLASSPTQRSADTATQPDTTALIDPRIGATP